MQNSEQSIQKQFGEVAANYATSAVHVSGADLNMMVASVKLAGDEHILDAGCGAGHTALAFAPHVKSVIAYDLTDAMLQQVDQLASLKNITNVTTQQGDVASLPFDDNAFDLIVSRYSAHHWSRPRAALREFHRVLKPGGMFILSDIVSLDDPTYDTHLQALEVLRDPSHVRDHSVSQWEQMLKQAGFASERLLEFELPLEFDNWHTRMRTAPNSVACIRALFAGAPENVRNHFRIPDDISGDFIFTIYGAVLKGSTKT